MTQTYRLFHITVQLPGQFMSVTDQRVTVQVVLFFFFTAMEQLGRCVVLIVAGIAVDSERNKVGPGAVQLLRQTQLRVEQGKSTARLDTGFWPMLRIRNLREAFLRDAGEVIERPDKNLDRGGLRPMNEDMPKSWLPQSF